ncbi:MAG: hypothetical protein MPEBLZ_02121 [Candidatus Methanoperedens nitroreducens]|uniref:Uncharacterized protein n=1 Tax=Candidatus Methanoperedens nitratireducens TaxID=1392998 RepID=A0A0P8C915_9EURY|nr:MAG: hypothetical protein MPEBLZ_02121 [Candidatus Methanoperedens sp. BLZ1]CAG0993875.1 hypothetical protein METP2_02784 [Methanosarcinales archaeon]
MNKVEDILKVVGILKEYSNTVSSKFGEDREKEPSGS